jgi:polyribonucleotide nucleotidyltransferase
VQKLEDIKSVLCQLAPDKLVELEVGRVAGEAKGAVLVKCGDTIILVTCCESKETRPDIDFFPLTVDFEERLYAVGRIPGSYNRREGRPNDKAILVSRLIDRPIRPLFPEAYHNDVHIVATVLSSDPNHPPDVLAMFGASAAIELAGLPFKGPIGAVRVGLIKGQFIINPTYEQLGQSQLDLIVAGTEKAVLMVEAGASFIKEEVILAGIAFAQEHIKIQIEAQRELSAKCNVSKREFVSPVEDEELATLVKSLAKDKLVQSIDSQLTDKGARENLVTEAYKAVTEHLEALPEENPLKAKAKLAQAYTKKLEKQLMRGQIMEKGERVDGRKCNEIRQIWCQVGLLPRAHGSGLFTRGSTQALSTVTLGSGVDAKPIDGIWPEREQTYYHHYNFPSFSVGEARSSRGTGRREVGHGALAERALIAALPDKEEFPYVIRVVSDVLSSNGSTSMASTCGSTLALMDAGVPLKSPVAGIAMGLILDGDKCAILSDIQGVEDFLGDMDFKVTGSRDGVTAIQLDLKLPQGINLPILKVALDQALTGRVHILEKMLEAIDKPRESLSHYAPRLLTIQVEQDQIGGIIGPSGKNIKRLIEETGVDKIDISDSGLVTIAGTGPNAEVARDRIAALTLKIVPGEEYRGIVARKLPIGLFVELGPGKVGLLKAGGPGPRGGRGGRYDRDRNGNQNNGPENSNGDGTAEPANFDQFQIDEPVMALVDGIDMKGRINLAGVRKIG